MEHTNITALLDRAFLCLEDGDFKKADEFCEMVLNQDAKSANAYLGKLMAELGCKERAQLGELDKSIEGNLNYQKAFRFGDDALKAELDDCRKNIIYKNACKIEEGSVDGLKQKIALFASLEGFKDSEERIQKCNERISELQEKRAEAERLAEEKHIEKKRLAEEKRQKRKIRTKRIAKKAAIIAASVTAFCIVVTLIVSLLTNVVIPGYKYSKGVKLYNNGEYLAAFDYFAELGNYKDVDKYLENYTVVRQKAVRTDSDGDKVTVEYSGYLVLYTPVDAE